MGFQGRGNDTLQMSLPDKPTLLTVTDWGKFGSVIVSMDQQWDCISLTESEARRLAKLLVLHADAIAEASKVRG